jgi:hypothetical protein
MAIAIVYLLWILFAVYEGKREAFYFSFKMKSSLTQQKSYKMDEHGMFTIQRLFVASIACIACYNNWVNCIFILLSFMACFPFFHDGMYYVTRQKLDGIYKKGWFDQSTTSTAKSDKFHLFDPIPRTVLFVLSVGTMVYEIIKFWK